MNKLDLLDHYVEQSKRARVEAEINAELARDMAKDPNGFNDKFKCEEKRTQKCPICGSYAESPGPGEPYFCNECGWHSDKPNGGTR